MVEVWVDEVLVLAITVITFQIPVFSILWQIMRFFALFSLIWQRIAGPMLLFFVKIGQNFI